MELEIFDGLNEDDEYKLAEVVEIEGPTDPMRGKGTVELNGRLRIDLDRLVVRLYT